MNNIAPTQPNPLQCMAYFERTKFSCEKASSAKTNRKTHSRVSATNFDSFLDVSVEFSGLDFDVLRRTHGLKRSFKSFSMTCLGYRCIAILVSFTSIDNEIRFVIIIILFYKATPT